MEQVLIEIAKTSPIIALLIFAVIYFYRREIKLEKKLGDKETEFSNKIDALNKELRDSEKENLTIISKLSDVIDDVTDAVGSSNLVLKLEIQKLKEFISKKLQENKNGK